jgi:hypothetical protein
MIGNQALADVCRDNGVLRSRVIRYVYRHDVVPHLPPTASDEFVHFGREYRYSKERPWSAHEWRQADRPSQQMTNLIGLLEGAHGLRRSAAAVPPLVALHVLDRRPRPSALHLGAHP